MRRCQTAPITAVDPNSFARHVLLERHPAIVRQVQDAYPYAPEQLRKLGDLAEEIVKGRITRLAIETCDHAYWDLSGAEFFGRPWIDVPFLWAESYFYWRLLEAVHFFGEGPWHRIDPFHSMKAAELAGEHVSILLDHGSALGGLTGQEVFSVLVRSAVVGNQADLGFRMGLARTDESEPSSFELLIDDTDEVWKYIVEKQPHLVIIIADNAGLEIISDLLLADFILESGHVKRVGFHIKPMPYYVSDAASSDVFAALRRLSAAGGWARDASERLMRNMRSEAIALYTHEFYCKPECFFDAPHDLLCELTMAGLVIAKGDLNYRRLVGDFHWDPTTPFSKAVGYFPTTVVALRALKSDVVVGLDAGIVSLLDVTGSSWRTNGSRGLVQSRFCV